MSLPLKGQLPPIVWQLVLCAGVVAGFILEIGAEDVHYTEADPLRAALWSPHYVASAAMWLLMASVLTVWLAPRLTATVYLALVLPCLLYDGRPNYGWLWAALGIAVALGLAHELWARRVARALDAATPRTTAPLQGPDVERALRGDAPGFHGGRFVVNLVTSLAVAATICLFVWHQLEVQRVREFETTAQRQTVEVVSSSLDGGTTVRVDEREVHLDTTGAYTAGQEVMAWVDPHDAGHVVLTTEPQDPSGWLAAALLPALAALWIRRRPGGAPQRRAALVSDPGGVELHWFLPGDQMDPLLVRDGAIIGRLVDMAPLR